MGCVGRLIRAVKAPFDIGGTVEEALLLSEYVDQEAFRAEADNKVYLLQNQLIHFQRDLSPLFSLSRLIAFHPSSPHALARSQVEPAAQLRAHRLGVM